MRTSSFVIALLATTLIGAQAQIASSGTQPATGQAGLPAPTPYAVVGQDGNSRVWQRTIYELGPQGQVMARNHYVTEIASGLNYWSNGQWVESQEQISVLSTGGASATQGQHQASFPGDLYQGEIQLVTPDGLQMQSRPLGLSYDDGNNTVLIATLTNSVGVLVGSNQVIYTNAFAGVDADVLYTYTNGGFEQDIILRAQPPSPESFGLASQNTRMQVLTEFFNPPQPNVTASVAGSLPDQNLDFGVMKMVPGKAFLMGGDSPSIPVAKQWVQLEGRQFLVEEIPMANVAAELDALPVPATQVASRTSFQMASKQLVLPPQRFVKADKTPMLVAKTSMPAKGFMLDYQTVNGSMTNIDFQGDTTYYISSPTYLYGTNKFEGGTILKYARSASLTLYASPVWQGAMARPVVFTAMDDNSMGDAVSGSSGTPSGYYGSPALYFSGVSANISAVRFLNAQQALEISDNGTSSVSDAQFVNCAAGIEPVNDVLALNNALFANVTTNFNAIYNSTVNAQNVTFNNSMYLSTLASGSSGTVTLTNDILSSVTNVYNTNTIVIAAGYNGFYKTAEIGSNISTNTFNPFQTVGGGNYYLTNGDSFLDAGTTNINQVLLADIQQKTTWPPVRFANQYISTPTNMSPQALRDTNAAPNLGYHYDPLDYIFGECEASNITFSAGTSVGWFRTSSSWDHGGEGIYLNIKEQCTFNGTVTNPCYFVRINTVQEQDLSAGYGPGGLTSWANQYGSYANAAIVTAQYLHSTQMAGDDGSFRDDYGILIGNFTDCEFDSTGCGAYVSTYNFTNCLFDRSGLGNIQGVSGNQIYVGDCTFHGGNLTLTPDMGIPITVQNSAFDGTSISISGYGANAGNASYNYNAYNGSNPFPFGSSNVVLTNFNWEGSLLGNYYLPTNSPLINAGSTNANLLGFYYFTTQTNQVPETNSIVDIGYHYLSQIPLPAISQQPANQTVVEDQTGAFDVSVSGYGQFSYQWLFDGAPLVISNIIVTVAGDYSQGGNYSGDGYAATSAALYYPSGVAVDSSGNLYIADQFNNVIRKVDTNGIITTVAGDNSLGGNYSGDGYAATGAALNYPIGVAVDGSGNLYIADSGNNVVRKVNTSGIITTVAGDNSLGGNYSGDGYAATGAALNYPTSVSVDGSGNLYIADSDNFVIRKVNTSGIITTVAGDNSLGGNYSGDGYAATGAALNYPDDVVVDGFGNLFISDTGNGVIRKVNTGGIITTMAGDNSLNGGYSGDGYAATSAALNSPNGIVLDGSGNLYIADSGNNVIREVNTSGIITTFAGNHGLGGNYSGDSGSATNAALYYPNGIILDGSGNLYIADTENNVIRKVEPNYTINANGTLTVNDLQPVEAGNYQLIVSNVYGGSLTSSVATLTVLIPPSITVQPANLSVTLNSNATFSVTASGTTPFSYQWYFNNTNLLAGATNSSLTLTGAQLTNDGYYSVVVTNIAGSVTSSNALLAVLIPPAITSQPTDQEVVVDQTAVFDVSDSGTGPFFIQWLFNGTPLVVSNIITTVAGNHSLGGGYTTDGGAATNAALGYPIGCAVDGSSNIYICDDNNNIIRKVDTNGIITTVAGNHSLGAGYSGDGGAATNARINGPNGITVDGSGNLYIADTFNQVVRKVDTNGIITTVAGNHSLGMGYSGDGGYATNAQLHYLNNVAVDSSGNLYICDVYNFVIRKVDTNGIITTVAGNHSLGGGYSGDGGQATNATLYYPNDVAVDNSGDLYICDTGDGVIREVNASGIITTVAGNNGLGNGYSGDGGQATNAQVYAAAAVTVDNQGNFYFADEGNNVIRKVDSSGIITTFAGSNGIGWKFIGIHNALYFPVTNSGCAGKRSQPRV